MRDPELQHAQTTAKRSPTSLGDTDKHALLPDWAPRGRCGYRYAPHKLCGWPSHFRHHVPSRACCTLWWRGRAVHAPMCRARRQQHAQRQQVSTPLQPQLWQRIPSPRPCPYARLGPTRRVLVQRYALHAAGRRTSGISCAEGLAAPCSAVTSHGRMDKSQSSLLGPAQCSEKHFRNSRCAEPLGATPNCGYADSPP